MHNLKRLYERGFVDPEDSVIQQAQRLSLVRFRRNASIKWLRCELLQHYLVLGLSNAMPS